MTGGVDRNRGRFIVVEGLDGSGKSTLAMRLAEAIGAELLATPGAALQPMRGPFHDAVVESPEAVVLFYAASCIHVGNEAAALVRSGRDVVMDRYWSSTLAYGTARGAELRLADVEARLVCPDFTLLLAIDEVERRRRLLSRGANAYDVETLDPRFAATVMAGYRRVLSRRVGGTVLELDEQVSVAQVAEWVSAAGQSCFPGAGARPTRPTP